MDYKEYNFSLDVTSKTSVYTVFDEIISDRQTHDEITDIFISKSDEKYIREISGIKTRMDAIWFLNRRGVQGNIADDFISRYQNPATAAIDYCILKTLTIELGALRGESSTQVLNGWMRYDGLLSEEQKESIKRFFPERFTDMKMPPDSLTLEYAILH